MKILVCNAGSTSLKFKLYEMPAEKIIASGAVERIGAKDDAIFRYGKEIKNKVDIPSYKAGIELFFSSLAENGVSYKDIDAVAYKTVLSRTCFETAELTPEVLQGMKDWSVLSPVHSAAYLQCIAAMKEVFPNVKMVGAFETDFHRTIPLSRKLYGVPYEWYEKFGVQRLGFHGASHSYIAEVLNKEKSNYRAISCHLGGSASVCAILDGKSVDTSFGMSLETGLIHANRVGDMDPTLVYYLESCGLSQQEILEGLQKKGGLNGISGVGGDLRYVEAEMHKGNERAKLALDVFVTGIVHYIGAFAMDLGGLDYLVFTAGIGEHSPYIRQKVCSSLGALGVKIDDEKNAKNESVISSKDSAVTVKVIPTDEEVIVARRAMQNILKENISV